MEYKIVSGVARTSTGATYELQEIVREEIKKGWKPIGGVSIDDGVACQAMIKE